MKLLVTYNINRIMFVCLFDRYLSPPRRLPIDLRFFVQHEEVMRLQGEIKEIFKLSPDQARRQEIGY